MFVSRFPCVTAEHFGVYIDRYRTGGLVNGLSKNVRNIHIFWVCLPLRSRVFFRFSICS